MTTASRTIFMSGRDDSLTRSIADRLGAGSFVVAGNPEHFDKAAPWGLVFVADRAPDMSLAALEAEAVLHHFETSMIEAAASVRDMLDAGQLRRVVLVASVSAGEGGSMAAALGGGLVALAKSWALEFADDDMTANTVLVDDVANDQVVENSAAETVAFFLSPDTAAISGQVIRISRDADAGMLPA